MRRAIGAVPVTLRAEVAAVELPVAEILALAPGSVVRLGARPSSGVSAVRRERASSVTASPGANGARRAIQIRHSERRHG